ncbi:hypothetical protein QBC32DRAFT_336232 [Pseudoneurospora amorphoporcata]|uniref:Uncharacterized protein n=1 Tax=Pseudoneurospora amorphoporcata TaxID=241081 RepID=A0AAN6P0Y6_9PEZI|nr:hypothetical protein QBC32DRAFT_336232 [Pseudoneurospora amorphoporcata]
MLLCGTVNSLFLLFFTWHSFPVFFAGCRCISTSYPLNCNDASTTPCAAYLAVCLSVHFYVFTVVEIFVLSGVRPAMLKPCRAIDAVNTVAIHMFLINFRGSSQTPLLLSASYRQDRGKNGGLDSR